MKTKIMTLGLLFVALSLALASAGGGSQYTELGEYSSLTFMLEEVDYNGERTGMLNLYLYTDYEEEGCLKLPDEVTVTVNGQEMELIESGSDGFWSCIQPKFTLKDVEFIETLQQLEIEVKERSVVVGAVKIGNITQAQEPTFELAPLQGGSTASLRWSDQYDVSVEKLSFADADGWLLFEIVDDYLTHTDNGLSFVVPSTLDDVAALEFYYDYSLRFSQCEGFFRCHAPTLSAQAKLSATVQ